MTSLSAVIGQYNETAEAAMRALDGAAGYEPLVVAVPAASDAAVPALSTYEPRISIPANSLLWGLSGVSAAPEGFTVQLTDTATKKPLFSQPISFGNATGGQGSLSFKNCYGQAQTLTDPIYRLVRPLVILHPGIVSVQIVNLAAAANKLQLCLHFATPTAAAAGRPNGWNDELDTDAALAMRAIRDPGTATPTQYDPTTGGPAGSSKDSDLIPVPFDVTAAGDNVIIGGNSAGRIAIYQLDMWNVAQQTITFFDGPQQLRGPFTDYPPVSGYGLPNVGKPHFKCQPGRPFILRLSGGTQVTGFINYRME
jgi:hypothetical protein